jgi:hypothetical protein
VRGLARQIEQGDNALLDGGRQGRDARRTGLVAQQAFDPLGHKPLLPTPDCRLAGARAAHDLRRAAAVCRQQHDVRSPHMLLSGIPICHDRHEPFAISGTYLDDDARAHAADSHLPASRGILIRTHPYGFIHSYLVTVISTLWRNLDMRGPASGAPSAL